ncbi:hypothetical protein EVAR_76623_1 [Eumeta japonica]|uniref:Uncharacterized protein n=1 Tax=Eumeta variegata TaxID=151549 RepID=A0A4C1T843_EUMVA|nr:hypothetical protein EVAR_76623_1 [Eumeta japonica]
MRIAFKGAPRQMIAKSPAPARQRAPIWAAFSRARARRTRASDPGLYFKSGVAGRSTFILRLDSDLGNTLDFYAELNVIFSLIPEIEKNRKGEIGAVNLYHEPLIADVILDRRHRRTSLTQIVSQISATTFELLKPVVNITNG